MTRDGRPEHGAVAASEPQTRPGAGGRVGPSQMEVRFERFLGASRGLIMIPVVGLVGVALSAFLYGFYFFIRSVHDVIQHPAEVGANIAGFLVVIDLFLIGATMLIGAFGFYELFISRIDPIGARPLPRWLLIRDLNDLKARVIAMIVLLASVTFIEVLVDFRSGLQVLELGAGVALVVGSLTAFLHFTGQRQREEWTDRSHD